MDSKHNGLSKESFDKLCRACLAKADVMYEIFDISYEDVPIKDLLRDLSIKLEDNDKLPQNICAACIAQLCGIYKFKKSCLEADSLLRAALQHKSDAKLQSDATLIVENDSDSLLKQTTIVDRRLKCPICKKFVSRYWFSQHMRIHTNQKPYSCSQCPAAFRLKPNLTRHIQTHTSERPHLCDTCGKSFTQKVALKRHRRVHTGEKAFICNYCGKGYSQRSSFTNHVERFCVFKNPAISSSSQNTVDSTKYECSACFCVFDSQDNLLYHICPKKPLDCGKCNKRFVSCVGLRMHLRMHRAPTVYACAICNISFGTRQLLTTHMLQHRNNRYSCDDCGKGFFNYSVLWEHRKVHTGAKPHQCNICQRAFSQNSSLRAHMLIHTGERPFTCNVCNSHFKQPNHLKYHMRTHTGEKPYSCETCGKKFSFSGSFKIHMRTHTGESIYTCDICGKDFYNPRSAKQHQKVHNSSIVNTPICMNVINQDCIDEPTTM